MPAAWTTPRNWTAGELVTAAIGNSAWRDNLMYLKDSPVFDGNVTVTGTTLLTGVATFTAAPVFSSATASQAVFTNGSKALVSNAITGTGNVVMSASPTLTGTIAGAAMTLSSTLGVTGATTLSSTVATGALTVTGAATVSTTLGVTGATTLSSTASVAGAMLVTGFARLKTGLSTDDTDPGATNFRVAGTSALVGTVTGGTYNGQTISSAASLTGTLGVAGLLTVSGFGTHNFSAGSNAVNRLNIENTTSGTAAVAQLQIIGGTNTAQFNSYTQGFTTSGSAVAASLRILNDGAGGIGIAATHASGAIRFYSGGTTERAQFTAAGNFGIGVTPASTDRLSVKGADTGGTNYMVNFADSAGAVGLAVRNDGLILTGGLANSPYNLTTGSAANAFISAAGFLQRSTSSLQFKTDFQSLDEAHISRVLTALSTGDGAGFTYRAVGKGDDQESRFIGWGAETVVKIEPLLVSHDADGKPNGVAYERATVYLTHGWQQHDTTIQQLAARIAALESQDN